MVESHREEIAKLEALYAGNPGGRVFVHLAEAYRKAGEHERARRILDEGLARHSDSASGFVVLGRVLADMQVTEEAETAFRRVLELDGGNLVALRWLGDLARQQGRTGEAAAHYRELLVRNPSNEEVRELVEIVERETAERTDRPARPEVVADRDVDEEEPALAVEPADDTSSWGAESTHWGDAGRRDADVTEVVPEPEEVTAQAPDTEPWSAAPGSAGAVEEPPVEFEIMDLEIETDPLPAPAQQADASADRDADIVSSVDPEDGAAMDDLDRDDEAAPVEIHLFDPSFEVADAEEEDEEYASEIDLSDMVAAGRAEDEEDYAGPDFIADLTGGLLEDADEEPDTAAAPEAAFMLLPDEAIGPASEAADRAGDEPAAWAPEALSPSAPESAESQPQVDTDPTAPEPSPAIGAADELSDPGLAALAGAAGPAAEARAADPRREAEPRREGETGPVTETMAVLYRSQGFHDRAAEVYRSLLRSRPGDERLMAKLREAEAAAAAAAAPSSRTDARSDDEAGEVWLRGVGAAWTAGDAAGGEATPYAWTPEPEESEHGDPIGSWLRELVTWKAGRGRGMEPAVRAETRPVAPAGGAASDSESGSIPDWLADPGASREWANASGQSAPPPEPESAPSTGASADAEPWAGTPASEAPQETPASGPWRTEPAAPIESTGDADAGIGWTPDELDRDVPPSRPAESRDVQPAQAEADDEAEDEDLEMFRSWLQSLKK